MNYIGSNVLPILAATITGLLIGALYRVLSVPHPGGGRGPTALLIVAFVAEFWLASILAGALILAPVQANSWTIAIGTAVVIWIGFVLPVLVVSYSARGLRVPSLAPDSVHWLLVMVAQAAVLNLIGLVRP